VQAVEPVAVVPQQNPMPVEKLCSAITPGGMFSVPLDGTARENTTLVPQVGVDAVL
jgi:hypothetical protein